VASKHPGALVPVVAAISAANPDVAPIVAATAMKQSPSEASAISRVAAAVAPTSASETQAKTEKDKKKSDPPGHNKNTPPAYGVANRPGTIRGNRPLLPPGLVRNPKPGRDDERDHYARP